ncbi:MAG: hypothetical protein EP297_16125 [Gammaproteobacteria bacterium]|nr:MAG: hypothetical protein EP297_16125 [Gammaproteobacteria bacterium]
MSMKKNTADIYHDIRNTVFKMFEQDPYMAYDHVDGFEQTLGARVHDELIAELEFYGKYRDQYELVLSDGDKDITDFTGKLDGHPFHFDVTTNDIYLELPHDDPFHRGEYKYKIAVVEKETGVLKEFVDINFPYCKKCKEGRVYDIALLLPPKDALTETKKPKYSQVHLSICGSCGESTEIERLNDRSIVDYTEQRKLLEAHSHQLTQEGKAPLDINEEINKYALRTTRYLKYAFDNILIGSGGNKFQITDPKTMTGYFETALEWRHPDISRVLPIEFGRKLAE